MELSTEHLREEARNGGEGGYCSRGVGVSLKKGKLENQEQQKPLAINVDLAEGRRRKQHLRLTSA